MIILHMQKKKSCWKVLIYVASEVIKSAFVSTVSPLFVLLILLTFKMPEGVEIWICPEEICCAMLLGSPLRVTLGSWPAASCDILKFELCGWDELGAMAMGTWVVWMGGAGDELLSLPLLFSPPPSPPPEPSLGPLTNTPPEPLCLFKACLCLDSYRYF